jgi:hypothetical protein
MCGEKYKLRSSSLLNWQYHAVISFLSGPYILIDIDNFLGGNGQSSVVVQESELTFPDVTWADHRGRAV